MKSILHLILFVIYGNIFGQNKDLDKSEYRFAKEAFRKEYSKKSYERFKGLIIENPGSIKFDEKTFEFLNNVGDYKLIFTLGILYPNIITGNVVAKTKSNEELKSLTESEKVFYNMMRIDSLKIGAFRELPALNPNEQIKRFSFWLFNKGSMNPTEYYFELENKEATDKTTLSEFIKNSILTFIYKGTIII